MATESLACSTITFRMLDLEGALERVAAAGLHAIDLGAIRSFCPHADPLAVTRDEVARLRDRLGGSAMRVSSLNAWSLTHLNDPESVERDYLRGAIGLASAIEAPVLTVQPGRAVEESRWLEEAKAVAALLEELGAEARERGLALAVEAPHKGTLADRFDRACALVELLDPQVVHVALDTSHVLDSGATIEGALAAYGSRVRHVHLRDFAGGSILVTPGDGEVDFHSLFTGLERLGYPGAYAFELERQDATADDMERELRRAIDHVARLGVPVREGS